MSLKIVSPGYRSLPKVILGVAAVAITAIPARASITMTQTLVAQPPAAFEKGYEFSLLGLHDSRPTFIAARVFKWSQRPDDGYVLEPSEDFSVYPQLLRMGADSRKAITIKATKPLPAGVESHYRIVLREFDRADGTDSPPEASGASIAVIAKPQVSIPMIVRGPTSLAPAPMQIVGVRAAPRPAPHKNAEPPKPGSLLTLYNPGQVYQRVLAIGSNEPAGPANQYLGYVLPGQRVDFEMPAAKTGDRINVQYVVGADAKVNWTSNSDDRKTVAFVVP